jgi:hypothetical protein
VRHVWDVERRVGGLFAKMLPLKSTVWDCYFLYPPGATWYHDEPPRPAFWMHQLPAASGADRDLVLYPSRFLEELFMLFGDAVKPANTLRDDLGLRLHCEGLANVARGGAAQHTLDQVQHAFEASSIESTS